MLPVSRRDEYLYSVPKFDLGKGDIKGFMNELVPCLRSSFRQPGNLGYLESAVE